MSRLQVARTLTDLHCILMRRRSLLSCPLARFLAGLLVLCVAVPIAGCDAEEAARPVEVVLYTSVDEPVARAVIERFQHETGYRVRLVTDTEATRSVGLAERLRAESARPRADVWWGNEPFHTVALAREGLLRPIESAAVEGIDPQYVDPERRWVGNGLRARVLVLPDDGTARVAALNLPPRLADLPGDAPPKSIGIARPTAGTTGGHVAALYVLWGRERADAFFRRLHPYVVLNAGNSQVAQQVGAGNLLLGLTDNDDVANARASGLRVRAVLPDQGADGLGTLTIPTTVGLVAGRPDSPATQALLDYLLSAAVEQMLIDRQFCAYSVRASAGELAVRPMAVEYARVADALPWAVSRAVALLEGRDPPAD